MTRFASALGVGGHREVLHEPADAHHAVEAADDEQGCKRGRLTPPTVIDGGQQAND